jgi:hypothetical protein
LIKWDKEGQFILIKGEIHQKKITTVNLYATQCQYTQFHQTYSEGLKSTYRLQLSGWESTQWEILIPLDHQYISHSNKKSIKKF